MVNSTINPKLLERVTANVKRLFPSSVGFKNDYEVSEDLGFDMEELFNVNEVGCVIGYVEEADLPKLYAEVPKMLSDSAREGVSSVAILWFFDANGNITRAKPMPIGMHEGVEYDLTNGGMTANPDYIPE